MPSTAVSGGGAAASDSFVRGVCVSNVAAVVDGAAATASASSSATASGAGTVFLGAGCGIDEGASLVGVVDTFVVVAAAAAAAVTTAAAVVLLLFSTTAAGLLLLLNRFGDDVSSSGSLEGFGAPSPASRSSDVLF